MMRILITAWLSLLLVGMQQQLVVHEVDHLRAKVQRGHDASVVNPASAECLECALLAGGANAAPAGDSPLSHHVHAATPVASTIALGEAQSKPAFYQSRGPPALV
ncbi:MAG TPA: hypothetical protein VGK44_15130 [Casimicrobiaceae bacterium]|jgi:hypothetical protein